MKTNRHSKILEIIAEKDIDTQEALQRELINHGYNVTQATISRDIRELDLRKVASPSSSKSRYCAPSSESYATSAKYVNILRETLVKAENAQNILVLKTYPGMANACAAAFDALFDDKTVGSIAGDDTIFIVTHNNQKAEELCKKVRETIN